jgi:hypothetical protein
MVKGKIKKNDIQNSVSISGDQKHIHDNDNNNKKHFMKKMGISCYSNRFRTCTHIQ